MARMWQELKGPSDMVSKPMCRLCFSDGHQILIDIFGDTGAQLRIADIIVAHFNCNVSEDGTFPRHVCTKCWHITETFHQFYQSVQQAEQQFLMQHCKAECDPIGDHDPISVPGPSDVHLPQHQLSSIPSRSIRKRSMSLSSMRSASLDERGSPFRPASPADSSGPSRTTSPTNIADNASAGRPQLKPFSIPINSDQIADTSEDEVAYVDKIEHLYKEPDSSEKRAPIDDIFAEAVVNEATLASKDTLTESSSEDEDSVATRASDADYCPDTGGVNADDSDDEPMDADNLPEHSPRTKRTSPKTQAKAKTKLEPQKRKRNRTAQDRARVIAERNAFKELFNEHMHRFDLNCEMCPTKFKTLREAGVHYVKVHSLKTGFIRCCKIKLRSRSQVVAHLKVHVDPDAYKCEECDSRYTSPFSLQYHIKVKHVRDLHSRSVECDICGKTLKSKSGMHYHKQKMHSGQQKAPEDLKYMSYMMENFDMGCDECDTKLVSFTDARTHYRDAHNIENGYIKCCGRKFRQFSFAVDHINWHLDPATFKCDVCDKKHTTRARLLQHVKRHQIDHKPFICDYCGKGFLQKATILLHMLSMHHDNEEQFECDVCSKRFPLVRQLRSHKYNVHRDKPPRMTCDICGKSFNMKHVLLKHMEMHDDDDVKLARAQQCEHCGEWLKSKSGLYYHEKIHTSGPQTCEQCGLVCANKIALTNHIRKYHRAPRFKCNYCDTVFTERTKLVRHEEQHTRHRTYPCQWCDKVFTLGTSRRTHQRRNHAAEIANFREEQRQARVPPSLGKKPQTPM